MAYKKEELEAKALEAINKYKLVTIEDVVSYLPCSAATFYNKKLEKLETIRDAIDKAKVELKAGIRKKMYESSSAAALIALYKILGTPEERHALNGTEIKTENTTTTTTKLIIKEKFNPRSLTSDKIE